MRRGFTLIVAVMFLLLISTLTALALNFAMTTMRQTSELYLREQAELLAQGATEYAVLEILNHNFKNGCLNNINGIFNAIFNYRVDIKYFGEIKGCTTARGGNMPDGTSRVVNITTPQSAGTVQLDVVVWTTAGTGPGTTPSPIRFHKRTLQKL